MFIRKWRIEKLAIGQLDTENFVNRAALFKLAQLSVESPIRVTEFTRLFKYGRPYFGEDMKSPWTKIKVRSIHYFDNVQWALPRWAINAPR
jgi:hypothetical protein